MMSIYNASLAYTVAYVSARNNRSEIMRNGRNVAQKEDDA
jgi:hypothetical protein